MLTQIVACDAEMGGSVILIRIDLTCHDHHPHQKDCSNDPKRKLSLPALTYQTPISPIIPLLHQISRLTNILLLQIRQSISIRPLIRAVKHIRITLIIDIRSRKQLYRSPNYTSDEEYQQDEREEHHGAWDEAALRNEDDFNDDEEDGECADCYAIRHDPVT
jgi:hypothetical protein